MGGANGAASSELKRKPPECHGPLAAGYDPEVPLMSTAPQISFGKVQFDCPAGVCASGQVAPGVDEAPSGAVLETGVVLPEDTPVAPVVALLELADGTAVVGVVPVPLLVEEASAVGVAAESGSIFMPLIWV